MTEEDEITRAAAEAKRTPWLRRTKEQHKAVEAEKLRKIRERSAGQPSWGEIGQGMREAVRPETSATFRAPGRSSIRARFEGAVLDGPRGTVTYKGTTVSLPATAKVETAGQIRERVTATRLVLVGVFAFALKKRTDSRELYLTVEGDGAAFVMELKPNLGHKAREFAAQINAA